MQGWNTAPYIADKVQQSWKHHNPSYDVVLLDADSVRRHLPEASDYLFDDRIKTPARSDIIRVELLARYGGVWADASMLCMQSLDEWLPDNLKVSPVYMYHSANTPRPCSWFIASTRDSYVMKAWRNKTESFWRTFNWNTTAEYPYFWMDGLFNELYASDTTFQDEWNKTPFEDCTTYGGPAYLHTRHHATVDDELYARLRDHPPHVIKLSVHGSPPRITSALEEDMLPNTTSYAAIRLAMRNTHIQPKIAVVLSHYTEPEACVYNALNVTRQKIPQFDVFFYTKGPRPAEEFIIPFAVHVFKKRLVNKGRE